ncbi:MAG: acyl carrier protein [Acidobacteria bacterium]|nr:acyl carrier protein [Acidobacteriota bacterium]MCI0621698.1 acyl carrier protein [Acidobacteriota bacterium]MCI0720139.1 acyl carrier protein [Acidobacteriota bacterium]
MIRSEVISERVREFVLSHFPLARQRSIRDADSLLDNGIVDSMGILELVNYIEAEFAVAVSDEDLLPENFQSIERVAAFVLTKQSASQLS